MDLRQSQLRLKVGDSLYFRSILYWRYKQIWEEGGFIFEGEHNIGILR